MTTINGVKRWFLVAKVGTGLDPFDYEDENWLGIYPQIGFKITVSGSSTTVHQGSFQVDLNDLPENVNQAPHTVLLNGQTALTIAENTAFDGTLSAQDDGLPNNNLTYSFDTTAAGGGNANGLFVIGTDGKIRLADGKSLNYEAGATYTIYVKASDGNLSSQTQAITITLTDVNEMPTDITYSTNNILVENAQVGDIITNAATATDPDSAAMNGGFVFALVNAQGNPISATNFSVNTSTGQITVGPNGLPDVASRTKFDVYVKVTDKNGSGLSYVKKIDVFVDPVAPTNQAPMVGNFSGSVSTDDNAAAVSPFGSVTITDNDSTQVTVTLSFNTSKGTLSNLGGFALNATGTAYVFTGTAAQAQVALRGLQYNPTDNATGAVGATDTTTFSLSVSDNNGNTTTPSTSIGVVSTVANRAPALSAPAVTHQIAETATVNAFAGVAISDTNSGDTITVTITLDDNNKGAFTNYLALGFTLSNNIYTYTGSAANARSAIRQLTFDPRDRTGASGTETTTFTITVKDNHNASVSSSNIQVASTHTQAANQPPVVENFSGSVSTDDNAAALSPFGSVKITDTDSTRVTITLTFDANKGTLSNLGTGTLNGSTYTFTGTAAEAQAALRALQYNPHDNATGAVGATDTTTFSLSVSDNNGNTTTPSTSIGVVSTVANRAPVLTVVDTTHTADANNNTNLIKPFANNVITVSDTNPNDQLTITITMDTASKGEIGGLPAGGSFAGGVFRYTGTVAQITAMLANLTYNPTDKSGTSNSSERTTFTVTLKDAGDASAPAVTQTIKVDSNYTVSNTQPSISVDSGKASHATTDSGAAALAFEGVTVSDADPNETLTVTISFAKNEGDLVFGNVPSTITKSGPADELGTRTYTLTGKAESLNIFLQNLVWFDPTDQPNATSQSIVTTQFTIGVKDPVNPRVTNTSVNVVTTVTDKDIPNAAPEIEGADTPVTKTVADIGVVKPFSAVSFSDNENDTLTVTITFDKTKGVLIDRLGDIYTSGTYTFVGDKTAATAAVQALTFNPTDRPYGAANSVETTDFTISVKDNSHSPVTNSNVHVASVKGNTAPFDLGPGNMAVQELAAKGAVVGTLAALDNNAGDAFTYTLLDNAGGRFALGADNRSIVVDNGFKLDFEQAQSHTITVQVKDREGAVFSKVLSIGVLDANPEVTIGSADNDVFKGGIGKDTLGGGFGNDILWGGNGNDTLTGNAGKDIFAFNTKLGTAKTDRKLNFDTITDFKPGDDTFWLDNAIFKKLGKKGTEAKPAKLNKKFFTIGDKANDKDDYLVYDSKKGVLYYDADGSGSKEAVEFAKLKTKLKMTYKDFLVI